MKRTLSLVLCFCLIFSMFGSALVGTAGAVVTKYNDLADNHWANKEIMYMSSKSILQGNLGNFRADDTMTKAEFVKVINYTFGLRQTASRSFADVSPSKWYYNDIMAAANHGYLTTNGNYVNPDSQLTREEACALVARYLGLTASSYYSRFTDASAINGAYTSYVIACAENGIINGYPNGEFRPKNVLTRAEASAIIYRLAGSIYTTSAYGTDANANYTNAVVNTNGVTVTSANLSGTVYVSEGTDYGTVTFQNCTINGTLKVTGAATVNLVNTTVAKLVVDTTNGTGATVNVSGNSVVNASEVNSSAKFVNGSTYTTNGFRTITMAADPYSTLTLDGQFPAVAINNPYNYVVLADADTTIEKLTIAQTAANVKLTGNGKVEEAVIAAAGANLSVVPEKFTIANGITATFAGVKYTGSGAAATYPKYYFVDGALEIRELRNVSGTLYYMIVPNNSAAPTAQQVINGSNYSNVSIVDAGSISLSAGYENVDTSALLSSSTNYDLYTYFKAYNASVTGAPEKVDLYTATTPSFAANYPIEGNMKYVSANNYTMPIEVKASSSCTAYAIAVPAGSVAPSASQIYETAKGTGTYNSNVTVSARAVVNVYSNSATTINLTGLKNSYANAYDFYVVLANSSASPVAIRSTRTVTTSYDTGFAAGYPVITDVTGNYADLSFKTSAAGTVYVKPYNAAAGTPTAYEIVSYGDSYGYRTSVSYGNDGYYYGNIYNVPVAGYNRIAAVFVPSNSATPKTPVYGDVYEGEVLEAYYTSTSTGFYSNPYIRVSNTNVNSYSIYATTRESGTVYYLNTNTQYPANSTIYNSGRSFRVYDSNNDGIYEGSANGTDGYQYVAALFVPDRTGSYNTYAPVYATYNRTLGAQTYLYPYYTQSAAPTMTVVTPVAATTASAITVSFNDTMYYIAPNATTRTALSASSVANLAGLVKVYEGAKELTYGTDYTITKAVDYTSGTRFTIQPVTAWKTNVEYTVEVSSNIKNYSGVALASRYGTFEIESSAPTAELSKTTGVGTAVDTKITLDFSEKMYVKTTAGAKVDLESDEVATYIKVKDADGNNVDVTLTLSTDGKSVEIKFDEALAANTTYTVKVQSLCNNAGVELEDDEYTFKTEAQGSVADPIITIYKGTEEVGTDVPAGEYIVKFAIDANTSKVLYSIEGVTEEKTEYTGTDGVRFEVKPTQSIKITAQAIAKQDVDKANSAEVEETVVGKPIEIIAEPVNGTGLANDETVELSKVYSAKDAEGKTIAVDYDYAAPIMYKTYKIGAEVTEDGKKITINSAADLTEKMLNSVTGAATYDEPIPASGIIIVAAAVENSTVISDKIYTFEYPVHAAGDLIKEVVSYTDGYVKTDDIIYFGETEYKTDAEGNIVKDSDGNPIILGVKAAYDYDLAVEITVDGEPVTPTADNYSTIDGFKKIVHVKKGDSFVGTYKFGDAANSEIEITVQKIAVGTETALEAQTETYFANPEIVINLTEGDEEAKDIAGKTEKVDYGTAVTVEITQPDLPTGFADWKLVDIWFGGEPYADGKSAEKPIASLDSDVVAKAKTEVGGKALSASGTVQVNPIAPKLTYNDEDIVSPIEYVTGSGQNLVAKPVAGDKITNWYRISYQTEDKTFAADESFSWSNDNVWGKDYANANSFTIELWSVYDDGSEKGRPSERATYTIKNGKVGDSTASVAVTVNGEIATGNLIIVNQNDTISVSTSVVGGTVELYKAGEKLEEPRYTFGEADGGLKIQFTARVTNNSSETVSQWVIVKPVAPEIVKENDNTIKVKMSNAATYDGIEYILNNGAVVSVEKKDMTVDTNKTSAVITGEFANGYEIKARSYKVIDNVPYYSADVDDGTTPVAAPTFNVESGSIIDIDQEITTTEGAKASISVGDMAKAKENLANNNAYPLASYQPSRYAGQIYYVAAEYTKGGATATAEATYYVRPAAPKSARVENGVLSVNADAAAKATATGIAYLVGDNWTYVPGFENINVTETVAEVALYKAFGEQNVISTIVVPGEVASITAIKNAGEAVELTDNKATIDWIIGTALTVETNGTGVCYKLNSETFRNAEAGTFDFRDVVETATAGTEYKLQVKSYKNVGETDVLYGSDTKELTINAIAPSVVVRDSNSFYVTLDNSKTKIDLSANKTVASVIDAPFAITNVDGTLVIKCGDSSTEVAIVAGENNDLSSYIVENGYYEVSFTSSKLSNNADFDSLTFVVNQKPVVDTITINGKTYTAEELAGKTVLYEASEGIEIAASDEDQIVAYFSGVNDANSWYVADENGYISADAVKGTDGVAFDVQLLAFMKKLASDNTYVLPTIKIVAKNTEFDTTVSSDPVEFTLYAVEKPVIKEVKTGTGAVADLKNGTLMFVKGDYMVVAKSADATAITTTNGKVDTYYTNRIIEATAGTVTITATKVVKLNDENIVVSSEPVTLTLTDTPKPTLGDVIIGGREVEFDENGQGYAAYVNGEEMKFGASAGAHLVFALDGSYKEPNDDAQVDADGYRTYTRDNLSAGTKYYLQIKAYNLVDGVKVWSDDVLKVEISCVAAPKMTVINFGQNGTKLTSFASDLTAEYQLNENSAVYAENADSVIVKINGVDCGTLDPNGSGKALFKTFADGSVISFQPVKYFYAEDGKTVIDTIYGETVNVTVDFVVPAPTVATTDVGTATLDNTVTVSNIPTSDELTVTIVYEVSGNKFVEHDGKTISNNTPISFQELLKVDSEATGTVNVKLSYKVSGDKVGTATYPLENGEFTVVLVNPVSVNGVTYESWQAAIDAISAQTTSQDINGNVVINENVAVSGTIGTGGNVITIKDSTMTVTGNLWLADTENIVTDNGSLKIMSGAKLYVNGVEVIGSTGILHLAENAWIEISTNNKTPAGTDFVIYGNAEFAKSYGIGTTDKLTIVDGASVKIADNAVLTIYGELVGKENISISVGDNAGKLEIVTP